jgi:hypothetical protein
VQGRLVIVWPLIAVSPLDPLRRQTLALNASFGREYRIGKFLHCGVRVVRHFARDRLWHLHSEARRGGLLGMTRSDRFATSAKCCDRLPASNRARVFLRLGGAIYSNDYLIPKNSLDTKMRAC